MPRGIGLANAVGGGAVPVSPAAEERALFGVARNDSLASRSSSATRLNNRMRSETRRAVAAAAPRSATWARRSRGPARRCLPATEMVPAPVRAPAPRRRASAEAPEAASAPAPAPPLLVQACRVSELPCCERFCEPAASRSGRARCSLLHSWLCPS